MAGGGLRILGTQTEAQRDDSESLPSCSQELRVAGLGVQVLFGFLLSLPFTDRFSRLSQGQRDLYLADPGAGRGGDRAAARTGAPITGWCPPRPEGSLVRGGPA